MINTTNMSEVERRWKRKLPYRIYDYNYKVGESYYAPQTEYMDNRDNMRAHKTAPPECANFAERFAARPFYGKAYGLPYDGHRSLDESSYPRRRSSSASRGDDRFERDHEPIVPSSRIGRGRERDRAPRNRRHSLNIDESDFDIPRRKFSLKDDLDFKTPISKYVDSDFGFRSSLDRDPLASEPVGVSPAMKEAIENDIKKLERKFRKADKIERGTGGPRAQQWSEVKFDDAPKRRSSVKHDYSTYRDPDTGATVRKTSYQETSRYESSKPPRAPPRPSRLLSIEDSDFKAPVRQRRRHLSLTMGDDEDFDFKPRSVKDNDIERKFSSAKKLFNERRAERADELGEKIDKMVNKMRKSSLIGDEPALDSSFTRAIRASSLDPEPRMRATQRHEKYMSFGYNK